jgi:ketosteroid isomerase-like protein
MHARELADRFFAASSSGDVEALKSLCSPDIVANQNGGPTMPLKGLTAFVNAVLRAAPDFRYEDRVFQETATGFVEEHDVTATTILGEELRMRVAVVATVEAGKMTSMREYLDTAAAGPLMRAFEEMRRQKA